MKFKIAAVMLIAVQLVTAQASAAVLTNLRAEITSDYNAVEITGNIDTSDNEIGDEVLIKILNPGYEDADIEAALNNPENKPILAVDSFDITGSSNIYKKIGLRSDLEDGRYYIYISGKNIAEPDKLEMWFIKDLQSYVNDIKAQTTVNDIKKMLFENSKWYDSDPDEQTYDLADVISLKNVYYTEDTADEAIAKIIFAEKGTVSDWSSLKKLFKTAAVIGAFETRKSGALTGESGLFKETIFDAAENPDMAEAEAFFENELNTAGRKNALSSLEGKQWNSIAEFEKDFAAQMLYDAVFNNINGGYGHVPMVIKKYSTWKNSLQKYDYSIFNNLTDSKKLEAASLLLKSGAKDPAEMYEKLMKIINSGSIGENNNGSTGGSGGGGYGNSYSASSEYVNALAEESRTRENEQLFGFSDMSDYLWAADAVNYLMSKGVVSGTGNNTFSPQRSITREEFAKMLVLTMGYDVTYEKESFEDVDADSWYAPYVATLKEMGITQGAGNNRFNVGAEITREEACTLIYRAASDIVKGEDVHEFVDWNNVDDYAKEAVNALSEAGIIMGNDEGYFLPRENMTRAEAAVVFYRLLKNGGNA